jgi:excinuclease ABC subunit C
MTASALDDISGLGEVRKKALLKRFGSLKRLAAASLVEIAEVPGIGPRTAEAVLLALKGPMAAESDGQSVAQGNSSSDMSDTGGAVLDLERAEETGELDGTGRMEYGERA